jgi:endonuclease/exonuclease/phosphatase (EEP) superfamily protein YafD
MFVFIRQVCAALVLLLVGGIAGVQIVAAAIGPFSSRIDVGTHLAPILAMLAAGGLLASWPLGKVIREWALAGCLLSWGACLALMAPEYLRNAGPYASGPQDGSIKVIQFNGYRGNTRVSEVVDWLISERPDIVTIQETRPDLREAILSRTGWSVAGLARGNLTIFSARQRITMDRPPNIGALHWVNATYPSPSGPYELITVHLDWPTSPRHARQRKQLIEMINTRPYDRLILTGDFNSTPWSYGLREIDARSGVTRRDRGLFSFPAGGGVKDPISLPLPVLPIDHVYAGPGWATVSVRRGPRLGSDHYPVVMVLAPVKR